MKIPDMDTFISRYGIGERVIIERYDHRAMKRRYGFDIEVKLGLLSRKRNGEFTTSYISGYTNVLGRLNEAPGLVESKVVATEDQMAATLAKALREKGVAVVDNVTWDMESI